MEIDGALQLEAANDVEYEDVSGAKIIVILGSLASGGDPTFLKI